MEGPTDSLLHRWSPTLEHFCSLFYFEVESAIYDNIHLLIENSIACTQVEAFLMDRSYLLFIVDVAHIWRLLGSLLTWPLVYVVYSMLVNFLS
jgi:hypothetical protein